MELLQTFTVNLFCKRLQKAYLSPRAERKGTQIDALRDLCSREIDAFLAG